MYNNFFLTQYSSFFLFSLFIGRYPNSVSDGYIQYQFYDSLQGLCSYLRGIVCTSAVLTAAGVGDAEATALSAAVVSSKKPNMMVLSCDTNKKNTQSITRTYFYLTNV